MNMSKHLKHLKELVMTGAGLAAIHEAIKKNNPQADKTPSELQEDLKQKLRVIVRQEIEKNKEKNPGNNTETDFKFDEFQKKVDKLLKEQNDLLEQLSKAGTGNLEAQSIIDQVKEKQVVFKDSTDNFRTSKKEKPETKANNNSESSSNSSANTPDTGSSSISNGDSGKGTSTTYNSPNENDFSLSSLLEGFSDYLSTLSYEQLLAISHLIFNSVIISCFTSIGMALFGNFLIDYFQIESRYPRLLKIIKLRRTFQKYYVIINVIYIIIGYSLMYFIDIYTLLFRVY